MKPDAPELSALIIIFRSAGPVISTWRSASAGGGDTTCQSAARIAAVSANKSGRTPASNVAWRSARAARSRARVGLNERCSRATNASASGVKTRAASGCGSPTISTCPTGSDTVLTTNSLGHERVAARYREIGPAD